MRERAEPGPWWRMPKMVGFDGIAIHVTNHTVLTPLRGSCRQSSSTHGLRRGLSSYAPTGLRCAEAHPTGAASRTLRVVAAGAVEVFPAVALLDYGLEIFLPDYAIL